MSTEQRLHPRLKALNAALHARDSGLAMREHLMLGKFIAEKVIAVKEGPRASTAAPSSKQRAARPPPPTNPTNPWTTVPAHLIKEDTRQPTTTPAWTFAPGHWKDGVVFTTPSHLLATRRKGTILCHATNVEDFRKVVEAFPQQTVVVTSDRRPHCKADRKQIPIVHDGGRKGFRNLWVTVTDGSDPPFRHADSTPDTEDDPVVIVEDTRKRPEKQLRRLVTEQAAELGVVIDSSKVFNFKTRPKCNEIMIRVKLPQTKVILPLSGTDSLFYKVPSFCNGGTGEASLILKKEVTLEAALTLAKQHGCYVGRTTKGFMLRCPPASQQSVRNAIHTHLIPPLPPGKRYILSGNVLQRYDNEQLLNILAKEINWDCAVVSRFERRGQSYRIVHSLASPSSDFVYVAAGFIVINEDKKKEDSKQPEADATSMSTTSSRQQTKRSHTEAEYNIDPRNQQ
eukprot:TRINITY_DN1174_c0_g1_i1.p2 TRINITY_DN1174_c0_g1~~TRINITY_DN1174_c0_g1_i1.p2  ORF type:complete len:495 (+),score=44.17 TRINITY_DN1174_c0_g1_i1:126-1487(+)